MLDCVNNRVIVGSCANALARGIMRLYPIGCRKDGEVMVVLDMEARGLEAKTCGRSVTVNNGGELLVELEVEANRINIARDGQAVTLYRRVPPLLAADCAEVAETERGYAVQVFGMTFDVGFGATMTRIEAKSGDEVLFAASRTLQEWEQQ